MNETIQTLINRRSIRNFNEKPVEKEKLELIAKAGTYAASGKNRQSAKIIVVQDPELLEKIKRLNCTSVGIPYEHDNFYGAKVIMVVIADRTNSNHVYDGSLVMGNLMNAACSLGVGSIWINRARETFDTEEGKQILKDLNIEGDYEGIGNCALGYYDGEAPKPSERKKDYVIWK